jgi:hypothetical protein
MTQATSTTIISGYRATSVVDTPMRKVEVLEDQNGHVVLRATEFSRDRAEVDMIHLEQHEAQALARALVRLEDQPDADVDPITDRRQNPSLMELKNSLDTAISELCEAVDRVARAQAE